MTEFEFVVGDTAILASAEQVNDSVVVTIGDKSYRFQSIGENLFQAKFNGSSNIIAAIKHKDVFYVDVDSVVLEVCESSAAQNAAQAFSHNVIKDKVFAPMPGKIVKIMVNKGDSVTEKQPLAIIEAMKMENQINSPASGKVKAVNFSAGDQVNTTSPIIELELIES